MSGFEFNNCVQSTVYFEGLKASMYKEIEGFAKSGVVGNINVRFGGWFVGLASAGLTIAEKAAGIAEPIIKGFANMGGALAGSEEASFVRGVKQLVVAFPLELLSTVMTVGEVAGALIITPVGLAISPEKYCAFRAKAHQESAYIWKEASKGLHWELIKGIENLYEHSRKDEESFRYVTGLAQLFFPDGNFDSSPLFLNPLDLHAPKKVIEVFENQRKYFQLMKFNGGSFIYA